MSVSMAGDAGVAGAGPSDPSSAAPSPASALGVATTSTSAARGHFRPPVATDRSARFRSLRRRYGDYKKTTQRRLTGMSAGEFD